MKASTLTRPIRLTLFAKLAILITTSSILPVFFATVWLFWTHHRLLWPGVFGLFTIAGMTIIAAFVFARHLTRPIRALMWGAERIARGDFSTIVETNTYDELQDLACAFNQMCEDMRRYSEVKVDELVAEKTKTEGIIFSSNDGIILTDQEGIAQLINPKAKTILGLNELSQDFSGRPVWSFVKDDRLAIVIRDSVEGDRPKGSREVNLSAEGVRCFYSISVSLVNAPEGSGTSYWIVLLIRNVTAEKELDQLKDDFLQSLTHDLRSPMTAIRGYLQVLGEEMAGPINPDQKKILRIMENASTKLLHIVSNLLDTAKMSAGKLRLNLAETQLRQLLPNTVELFHTEAAKKKITLTLDLPEEMTSIKVDPGLLERVIINLVGNAIKFTPEGGFVTVKFMEYADRIQGQVIDTGTGMPPEFMGRIFKKFEQVSGTRGGTGLGLAICKFIVDAHYGELQVRSKSGEGTTFTLTIPKGLEQNERGEIYRIRPTADNAA
ncbi:MAG: ATP-binding protein [Elusimicrobiota bacterium]|jgi:PAS domain S-box-containing protein